MHKPNQPPKPIQLALAAIKIDKYRSNKFDLTECHNDFKLVENGVKEALGFTFFN
jgi:hypothetical protein